MSWLYYVSKSSNGSLLQSYSKKCIRNFCEVPAKARVIQVTIGLSIADIQCIKRHKGSYLLRQGTNWVISHSQGGNILGCHDGWRHLCSGSNFEIVICCM